MPIENRELSAGTRLMARYKKQDRTCEVVQTENGLRYRLDDGTEYASPSSAGRAAMGGVACNGWRFWTLEGEAKPATQPKPKTEKAPAKKSAKSKTAKKPSTKKSSAKNTNGDSYGCGVCPETFPTMKAATKHVTEAHSAA